MTATDRPVLLDADTMAAITEEAGRAAQERHAHVIGAILAWRQSAAWRDLVRDATPADPARADAARDLWVAAYAGALHPATD